jgi:hypothetical protein
MTNQQSTQPAPDNGLSDARMDGLLRDFFRLEVPVALHGSPAVCASSPAVAPVTVVNRRPAVSRIAIIAALAMLSACLLLTFNSDPSVPQGTGVASRGKSTTAAEELMPVSSAPDPKASGVPVDENGLLLKETEEIQLNPRQ